MFTAHQVEHLSTLKVAEYFTRFLPVFFPLFGSHNNRNSIEKFLGCIALSCIASIIQIVIGVFLLASF